MRALPHPATSSEGVSRIRLPFSPPEDDAAELFALLRAELGVELPAAFLDSSDHTRTAAPARSRYSILAFSVGKDAQMVSMTSGAFEWLAEHWPHRGGDKHRDPVTKEELGREGESACDPPFQLGWLGWVGYQEQAQFFTATCAVVIDHQRRMAEIQSRDDDTGWKNLVSEALSRLSENKLSDQTPAAHRTSFDAFPADGPSLRDVQVRDSQAKYIQAIEAAQEQIRAGNSYEVCLTTAVTAQLIGDPWQAYCRLRQSNRAPFTQFLYFPPTQHRPASVILSTSPERFASITVSGRICSEPIKGTRGRGTTPELDEVQRVDLLSHPKDRAENVMIADLVRNDLSIHAVPGSLRTERLCAVETYPSVHQMVSTISAQLEPNAVRAQALGSAFPPGSMTGAPKVSTMKILNQLETGPRDVYSGVAGWFSTTGACDLAVLIRTAVCTRQDPDQAPLVWDFHLGLGGAITADSDPEAEWEEVITKSHGVLRPLNTTFPGDS